VVEHTQEYRHNDICTYYETKEPISIAVELTLEGDCGKSSSFKKPVQLEFFTEVRSAIIYDSDI